MTEEDRKYVDGCAIFYRTSKYVIHEVFHLSINTNVHVIKTLQAPLFFFFLLSFLRKKPFFGLLLFVSGNANTGRYCVTCY